MFLKNHEGVLLNLNKVDMIVPHEEWIHKWAYIYFDESDREKFYKIDQTEYENICELLEKNEQLVIS